MGETLPAVPLGSVVGERVIVGAAIVNVYCRVPVKLCASVAVTVIGKAPACVGVPLRTPVVALRVRPVGSVPLVTVKEKGQCHFRWH